MFYVELNEKSHQKSKLCLCIIIVRENHGIFMILVSLSASTQQFIIRLSSTKKNLQTFEIFICILLKAKNFKFKKPTCFKL